MVSPQKSRVLAPKTCKTRRSKGFTVSGFGIWGLGCAPELKMALEAQKLQKTPVLSSTSYVVVVYGDKWGDCRAY